MKPLRHSQYEFRCYAGAELYERVLREAAVRRISVSQCVRTDLGQYYAIRDELTDCVQVEQQQTGSAVGRRILHTLLAEMETRVVASLGQQSSVFEDSVNVLAWMIDEALLTILSAIPNDQPGVYRPRVSVLQMYDGWRAKVAERITAPQPRWLAPGAAPARSNRSE